MTRGQIHSFEQLLLELNTEHCPSAELNLEFPPWNHVATGVARLVAEFLE